MKQVSYTEYHRDSDYQKFEPMFRNIFRKRFNILFPFLGKIIDPEQSRRVLDIGASVGTMLDIFKENGWQTWGVEPSKSAEIAARKGHKIVRGFFEKVNLPEKYLDLVIMNHTLEHMDDPLLVLKKANKILKKGGIIFIDVPNFGGLGSKILGKHWPYLFPEEHKHQFTKESLSKLLSEADFKVTYTESRSGIFEYADPFEEFLESLFTFKKRFFTHLMSLPFDIVSTVLDRGDSMSVVGNKIDNSDFRS